MPKELTKCSECDGVVTSDGIGHRADCSECTDDGSEEVANAWLSSRPEAVRKVIEKYHPTHLFRMKSTGHRVWIESFAENDDDTVTECTVIVSSQFNPSVFFDRRVPGIELTDLEDLGEYKPCQTT